MHGDETRVVHETEQAHDELAVHPIRDPAVAGDRFAEIFDLESAFQARREEAAKGGDQRCEGREDHRVELHRRDVDHTGDVVREEGCQERGRLVGMGDEDGVWRAVEPREEVGSEVLNQSLAIA